MNRAALGAYVGALKTDTELVSERQISGFVLDPTNLDARFVVELLLDGYPAAITRANLHDEELRAEGFGDGGYRFVFGLDAAVAGAARSAEVRLANTGQLVGAAISLVFPEKLREVEARDGEARWVGGLRITGWIPNRDSAETRNVRALIDGAVVAEVRADLWTHVGEGSAAVAARAFDLNLPLTLADGRLRRARVVDSAGRDLPGSPCPFVAFPRGLESFLEERAESRPDRFRGRLFDRLVPQAIPMAEYAQWARAFPPEPALTGANAKYAIALVGETDLDATVESLESDADRDWVVGALGEGDCPIAFRPDDLAQFLATDARDCDIIVFSIAGVVFHPLAIGRLVEALAIFPAAKLAYCDVTVGEARGSGKSDAEWPIAFSAFDYERMLEQGYGSFVFAARVSHVREAVLRGVDDLFRLFNLALDATGPSDRNPPVHVPGFLARLPRAEPNLSSPRLARATAAHLSARRIEAVVRPGFGELFSIARVQRRAAFGKVSILIPTRDRVDLLRPCLESLRKTLAGVDHEIIVIDNDSAREETRSYFEEIVASGARIIYVSGPFNFARIIDAGASIARGEFLLLLNNDIEALRPGWLEEMLCRMAEPDVGAVGALLTWPSGVVQHGGVVLGVDFAASHAFNERIEGDPGYADLLMVAREVSAVTAACLLTRRRLFLDQDGLDGARFPVLYNDVDYCLRLRAAGKRVVFTPHAKLLHRESASRGKDPIGQGPHRHQRDIDNLRSIWGEALLEDPFYSPLLSLDGTPYSGLAWPPRGGAPRLPRSPPGRAVPSGF
jgi:GT2 family glycosyltransferase